jgi:outer membrane protein assembly factor BamB
VKRHRPFQSHRATTLAIAIAAAGTRLPAEDWPGFRGPAGQGLSTEKGLPLEWSRERSVAWKTAIPGEGWSSPIVAAGRVIITAAGDGGASCLMICLDRDTGKVRWTKEVFRQVPSRKEGKNSYASSTPVTDGERVYAVFADGSFAALTLDGEVAWINREHKHFSKHGLGCSPRIYRDLLIMAFDGSSDGDEPKLGWKIPWDRAAIVALDRKTGKVRWRASRGLSRIAHVTPTVLQVAGRDQLVSGAGDVVQGFDLSSGERIWSVYSQGEGVVPSIVTGGGLVFSSSGFEKSTIRAVRPDGKGDVTRTHIVWEHTKAVPCIPSFLYLEPHLYTITEGGVAQCLKAATGEVVWQGRLDGSYSASPVAAEGRIYFLNEEGQTTVIEAGPRLTVLARNRLEETCQASPAISGGRIFIRTEKNLFAIGK